MPFDEMDAFERIVASLSIVLVRLKSTLVGKMRGRA
jgi:hypothetical protein